jgi:superfamily II DNA or RNA helicase
MTLRYYQQDACDAIHHELQSHRSTMAVMATGLGKTRLFTHVAHNWPDRVLVLAHRAELVTQAYESLSHHARGVVEIEQGPRRSKYARIVVGSVQSVAQPARLSRLGADAFGLIICDEAHRYLAKTYRRVLDHFARAKVLGVTATADRGDKQPMKEIMDSVAYRMDIKDGIGSGYLVPLKIGRVAIQSIDLSMVPTVAGDLHEGKLEKVMLENVGAVVEETRRLHPNRQAIMFFPGVESAELAAQHLNAQEPGCAVFVSGKTPKEEREEYMNGFREGKYKYLSNCQVATEGFDAPRASLVVIARPTTSRALYTQMVGRGSRVLPDCVDGVDGKEGAAERRALIEWSEKPNCVVLDFVGNSGKHTLVSPVDLLGGEYTDEERKVAKKLAEDMSTDEVADPEELLETARKRVAARHRVLREAQFRVESVVDYVDAFEAVGIDYDKIRETELQLGRMKLSTAARETLERHGVDRGEVAKMTKLQGEKLMRTLFMRAKYGYCSYTQMQQLKKWGIKSSRVYRRQAGEAIRYLRQCDYGKRSPVDLAHLEALATAPKQEAV